MFTVIIFTFSLWKVVLICRLYCTGPGLLTPNMCIPYNIKDNKTAVQRKKHGKKILSHQFFICYLKLV